MSDRNRQAAEQRATFRVSVKPRSGLDAHLLFAGKKWPARIGDLSSEAVFVRLERGAPPALRVEGNVDIEIAFEDERFMLHGVIRSQRAGGYGIHFPERDRDGRTNPRDKLAKISAHLQRTDLSRRAKVLKLPRP